MLGVVLVLALLSLPALARLLEVRARRRTRHRAWLAVGPPQVSTEPLRGWKVAQVVVGPDARAWLAGVTGRAYGVDAVAGCERAACTAPGLDCRCGFYAFRDRDRAMTLMSELDARDRAATYALLSVDLDGEVLELEHGFRAARQRVHRVELAGTCATCRTQGHLRPAPHLLAHPTFRAERVLAQPSPAGDWTALPPGSAPVRAVCAEHRPSRGGDVLDLDRLRTLLTTEVTRLPSPGA